MSFRNGFARRPVAWLVACATSACFLVDHGSRAQEAPLDPMDIWYRGFLLVQEAGELEKRGEYLMARNKLGEAKPFFDHLAQAFPEFQTEMVRERRHLIAEKRDELQTLMRQKPAAPPLPQTPASPPPGLIPQAIPVDLGSGFAGGPGDGSDYHARSRSMEIENADGDFLLPSWEEGSSRAVPQNIPGMPRVQTGRAPSVGELVSSINSDLSQKDSLIQWLNDENLKLRKQLSERELMLERVQQELSTAQASRSELMRQIQQAEAAGGGIAAQQKIEQLKELLRQATDQLQEATDRNTQLVSALAHSQGEMKKLKERLAAVERERDNLAEVLNGQGNSGKALQELMERNQQLTSQLDRAEQLAESLSELSKEKDEDIAMLKSEISKIKLERDRLVDENLLHQQQIDELQRKLEMLSDGLTAEEKSALASASPLERRENEQLRSIILKQLRRQAQVKEAKKLLLSQLDKVGARSDALLGLVEDMATGSQLTEEEIALIKTPQLEEIVEAALASTVGGSGSQEGGATMSATLVAAGSGEGNGVPADGVVREQKVAVELAQLEKSARFDFSEGRYAEAEASFLEYLRYRPRSVSCLCNLGVLKIALKNYSEAEYYLEKALAIEKDSGLAHYLLGRVYFLQEKLDEALAKLEEAITHDPQNAKAHNTVGVISSRKGWIARAERAFASAVSIDPKFGDAHFNLAVLYATRDEPDAKAVEKHYFEALHLGVPRDSTIEEFLDQAAAAGSAVGMR